MAPTSETIRPLASFPEDIWGDRFLEAHFDSTKMEAYGEEIDQLKEQVRAMISDESAKHDDKLQLISVVHRLGISYYYEREIESQLKHMFETYPYVNDYDLYNVAVHFRVFRQHGYKMSCHVFNKFKDGHGKLNEVLKSDVKGILSLYEAAHLRTHNEEFLDEAFDMTTNILKFVAKSELEDPYLYKQVVNATKQALHFGVKRTETRHFISFYEEDASRDETLLRLAKLDFNMLQMLHRQELSHIVRWWKSLDVKTLLPHVRDRSLECHYWAIAIYFEGRFSQARLYMAKVFSLLAILDDTYDAYGTFDELKLLTQAFERWEKSGSDELPGKMKLVYEYVYKVYDDFEKEMARKGREYAARYAKARALDIIRAYYQEVIWCNKSYTPSYEEYMEKSARITSVCRIVTTTAMMGMEEKVANEKAFEWVVNPVPRLIRGMEVVGRLMDDIVTHEEEQQRALHVASAVECYMNEHKVSRDETVEVFRGLIRDGWKDMNEELMKTSNVAPRIVELPFNLARLVDSLYKDIDGFTYSAKVMKDDAILVYSEHFDV